MAEDPQPLGDLKANVERALEQSRGVLNIPISILCRGQFHPIPRVKQSWVKS